MTTAVYKSPLGLLEISSTSDTIMLIRFVEVESAQSYSVNPYVESCIRQLEEYFNGLRKGFDLKLEPEGTEFQKKVWNKLLKIPFGETISYLELSRRLGDEKAIRAVANANGQNNIPIVIPCHRVIGSDGSLTGYGGGLWRKKWLLEHEQKFSGAAHQMNLF